MDDKEALPKLSYGLEMFQAVRDLTDIEMIDILTLCIKKYKKKIREKILKRISLELEKEKLK